MPRIHAGKWVTEQEFNRITQVGTIKKNDTGNLFLSTEIKTQKELALRAEDIEEFKLKENDFVGFDYGQLYEKIHVTRLIKRG